MRPHSPPWLKTAVFYQIYPQSFYDTNADGIGDLRGIIRQLDYIQSLGVNALWINPCFDSPFHDAGYDIRDFYRIAPRYGSNDDMKVLVREAQRRGIRVLLDLVVPHTSIDHPWFIESAREERNRFSNWYVWSSNMFSDPHGPSGKPYACVRGYSERQGGFATNFFWCQPKLNFGFAQPDPAYPEQLSMDHPDIQALWTEMKDVIRYWLDMGCSGYRCDSAKSVLMGMPANEPEKNGRFWCEVNRMLADKYPDAALFCEWGWPVDSVQVGFPGNLLLHNMKAYNSLFRFPGTTHSCGVPLFSPEVCDIRTFLDAFLFHYLPVHEHGGYIGLPTGNHDCPRVSTGRSAEMMKCVFAFLLTMPGIPFVYYGEEIGMRQLNVKTVEGGYNRTGCRSPMQWDSSLNAGFSAADSGRLYIPIDPAPDRPTVAAQDHDPASQLNGLRRLATLRKEHPALQSDADFSVVYAESGKMPFVYRREKDGEALLIALNPAAAPATFSIGKPGENTRCTPLDAAGCRVTNGDVCVIDMVGTSYAIFDVEPSAVRGTVEEQGRMSGVSG